MTCDIKKMTCDILVDPAPPPCVIWWNCRDPPPSWSFTYYLNGPILHRITSKRSPLIYNKSTTWINTSQIKFISFSLRCVSICNAVIICVSFRLCPSLQSLWSVKSKVMLKRSSEQPYSSKEEEFWVSKQNFKIYNHIWQYIAQT